MPDHEPTPFRDKIPRRGVILKDSLPAPPPPSTAVQHVSPDDEPLFFDPLIVNGQVVEVSLCRRP